MRVAVLLAVALAGCSDSSAKKVTIEGLPYSFPKNHVNSIVRPDEGQTYVRLHPPGYKFALMHHPRSDRREREQKTLVIATVNTSRFSKSWSVATQVGVVICTDTPHYNCGFELYDRDVRWSVVFDGDQLPQVSDMKSSATALLTSYRSGDAT